jgi:Tfp pilus assembly protein PilE
MVIGIVIGVVGGVLAGVAYPVYNAIVKAKRKKIAPEIIRLTDELMK